MNIGWMTTKSTYNIGDEFQNIAARQFIEEFKTISVERENLSDYMGEKIKMIMNGWYMHNPQKWPPTDNIIPLLISMHISNHLQARNNTIPDQIMLNGKGLKYFQKQNFVGCRDLTTLDLLRKKDINAYYSGCMTLTLKYEEVKRQEYICLIDVSKDIEDFIRKRTTREIIVIKHERENWPTNYNDRLDEAKKLLEIYRRAHMVITPRLHGALPCIAMETPVLLVRNLLGDERYEGLKELTNYCIKSELLSGRHQIDFENPIKNPTEYVTIKENLIKVTKAFIKDEIDKINIEEINEQNLSVLEKAKNRTREYRRRKKLLNYDLLQVGFQLRKFWRKLEYKINM
jgi:hypothetical protein